MGKMYRKIIFCMMGIICLGAAAILGYWAGSRQSPETPAQTQTFYATVESIAKDSLTVRGLEINDVNTRGRFELALSEETVMEWNHTAITTEDLKPGSRVSVTYSGEVTETDPAGIRQVQRITLLEDELDHLPRLVVRDANITAMASLAGYGSVSSVELTYEDIQAIWDVQTLPGIFTDEMGALWNGQAEFYEDGSLAVIELYAYNGYVGMDIELPIAHISLRPEEFPQQVTYFDDETPTCTLWETPVVALAADMTYHGNAEDNLTPYQEFYMRFMTSESIGFDATFYAPEGRVENTKKLMNTIAGYCLDPENTFTIEAIKAMAPEAWSSDSGFTRYLPEAFEDHYLQYHFMNVTSGEKIALFNYSESESDDASLRWRIRQTHGAVEAVDIDQPKTYDLRSNESIDSSDRFTLGLSGQLSDEAIDTLANPIIRLDDLTEEVIAGRIFEDYESYNKEPYLALSVLYPDFTVVTFEGHWDPAGLYDIFRSLPLGDDHDEEV